MCLEVESFMYLEELFGLKGKVAVVTGGGRGIGQTVSIGLAKAGAEIVILCRSGAEETVKMIEDEGGKAYWIATDVTKEESVDAAFSEILNRSGAVNIVINNSGICMHQSTLEATVAEFREVIDVNLTGQFIVARAAGKVMIDRGIRGSIINVASMSGSIVNVPQIQCSYNASKAAVIHMTKSLAAEWAQYQIRVNSLSPGYVATTMSMDTSQELKDTWMKLVPMHRMANPEELMPAVLYLACDASGYTSGSDVIVDGAYTCL
ncbi:SDR family oxidoreductase [Cytobacillus purgationiresistens]|uniref:NAD(P)-dependent dehydrogenase (Short-subunit alcohol dehydrogenase family) n=1 Tax=Cytobacillus purgationiresistens TaxID=863449 RepID=A0ABU0AD48_9BACI|nr:SDR family oxidoreductase [Cytobacillus purgationiresistens]MDQ0269173.1 NAD(P)-dependent dehydrogenase (short-subunit alcohol dehydrogenase family) [Cytobacillus purgationiresistens]